MNPDPKWAFLALLAVALSGQSQLTLLAQTPGQGDGAVKPKAWVAAVEACLASAEKKSAAFMPRLAKWNALGPPPPLDDFDRFLVWRHAHFHLQMELGPKADSLKEDLFELWKITAHGAPLLARRRSELVEHADEVCKEYRAWVAKHRHTELQHVIRREIPAVVEAVRTEYCYLALAVLKHWIYFTGDWQALQLHVTHTNDYDLTFDSDSRERAHRAMKDWYESDKDLMRWHGGASIFVRWGSSRRFQYPEFKLRFGLDE
jgi:hypothetical protein